MYEWAGRLYRRYLDFAQRHPWPTLGLLALISALFFWVGSGLKVKGDLEDLFPEDTPAVQRGQETRRVLGNTQELRVLIGGPERDENRAVAAELATFLEGREDVSRVDYRLDISFFEKNGLLFATMEDLETLEAEVSKAIQEAVAKDLNDGFELDDEEEAAEEAADLPSVEELKDKYKLNQMGEYSESPDGQVIAVKAYPDFKATNATKTEALNGAIEAKMAEVLKAYPEGRISYVMDGDYSQVTKAAQQIMHDIEVSGTWSIVGIAVVVILFFRRMRALLFVLVILGLSAVWMMAFAKVAVGHLNLVTSIIFAILFGMGVDFVIHGLSRVNEEYHGKVPLNQAVRTGMLELARPVFNAMLTTAVTFFALIFFDFRGFSELGIIAGFGVAFALLIFYLAYPAMATAFHRIWPEKPRNAPPVQEEGAHAEGLAASPPVSKQTKRFAWVIVGAMVLLGVVATVLAFQLPFDSDMGKFRVQDNEAENWLKKKYRESGSRGASPALIITDSLAQTERAHRYMEANLKNFPIVEELNSVYTFVPEGQTEKLELIREIKRKLDNKYNVLEGEAKTNADQLLKHLSPEAYGPEGLPQWLKDRFTDTEGRFGRYLLMFTSGRKADALVALETARQVGEITLPAQGGLPEVTLTSSASFYITGEAYAIVKREGPWAAIIGLLVVCVVVLMDFRRPKELLMILGPILIGFAVTLGTLVLIGVPIDLFNVVVLPQIFGIGIDTGTHLTHRIKGGGPNVVSNVRASAIAAGVSSSLTVIGFAALLPVSNQGLQSIGLLAVLGVTISYIVNIIMFTAFQWILRPLKHT